MIDKICSIIMNLKLNIKVISLQALGFLILNYCCFAYIRKGRNKNKMMKCFKDLKLVNCWPIFV